jgi:ATP-dependent DNA helicase DinG
VVLVQGTQSRTRLLGSHMARVESGLPSVIFGMQSFGEGLDLPGKCAKPCLSPSCRLRRPVEPVDEARAEWLRSVGRDPFNELVIPATGIKLLQWTGRAIRTEDDMRAGDLLRQAPDSCRPMVGACWPVCRPTGWKRARGNVK